MTYSIFYLFRLFSKINAGAEPMVPVENPGRAGKIEYFPKALIRYRLSIPVIVRLQNLPWPIVWYGNPD